MAMSRTALYSKVRKIMKEVAKRRVWQKANRILLSFLDEFGTHRVEDGSLHGFGELSINTGSSLVTLQLSWDIRSRKPLDIKINTDATDKPVFHALGYFEKDHVKSWSSENGFQRFVNVGNDDWIFIETYRPGQWERALQYHEAKRLLYNARNVSRALVKRNEERERKKEDFAKKNQPLTYLDIRLIRDFGIRV